MKHVKLDMTDAEMYSEVPMSAGDVALKNATMERLKRAEREYKGCVSNTPESHYYGAPSGCVGEVRVAG